MSPSRYDDFQFTQTILRVRSNLAAARFLQCCQRLLDLLRKANFDPNQPRVPRGQPTGGQWTDDPFFGGSAAYRHPGAVQDPPVLLVQNKPSHPYAVQSLYDHEGYKGGHTIERHVGKSDTYLLKRLTTPKGYRLSFFGQPRPVYHWEESTFRNIYEAQAFINATLSDLNNNSNILDVINEIIPPEHGMAIEKTFARIVGHGYVNKAPKYRLTYRPMQPKRVVMYAARVVIYRDPDLPAGFRVHSAYPIEEQKR